VKISDLSLEERIEKVKNFAKELGVSVLLKGNPDIISDGRGALLNKTGCPEMAVAGTGDILAGICGCFLSQKIEPLLASSAAAYVSGKAGEAAKEEFNVGLLATDIIEYIPRVIKIV
jgi:NAD(P)H-hydrate epimerase